MSLDYSHDPPRDHKDLLVRKDHPYNAEPNPTDLIRNFITPERYFFCRSHGFIPDLDEAAHEIAVEGIHVTPHVFSVNELKTRFPKKSVMMAMQCAGNRRDGLHQVKHTEGVIWGPCAVANAVYSGCRLKDVLESVGIAEAMGHSAKLHVAFQSMEQCEEDQCYGSSIPLSKALDEFGDVLLAYEMNGAPLARDHGFPIRVVVPGYIGARSVKFLKSIRVQDKESSAYYQQHDYKILPESVANEKQAEGYWSITPSIGEYNVQSFVCSPPAGMIVDIPEGKTTKIQGYALSGGGRSIQRVDVSGDDGQTWVQAELQSQSDNEKTSAYTWSWSLWTVEMKVIPGVRVVSRAVDSAGNIQQEFPVWNYRGVMNNAWRTVERENGV
ncbi:Oxidoreductase, molybdopterin-binding domain-containing protein [Fennellomyces sp. T-0311]|nr:Oxidoreductase, molybdopterin-binding domain-containing protein [Fennellomyces sp. T-0311]